MQTGIHLVFSAQLASDKTKTQMLQITSNLNKLYYPNLNESTIDNRHNETRQFLSLATSFLDFFKFNLFKNTSDFI